MEDINEQENTKTYGTQNGGDTIKSNLEFVNEEMDYLINTLDGSIDHFKKHMSGESFTSSEPNNKVYTKMNDIMSEYSTAQKELLEKLKREAKFVKYVGQTYADLDKTMQGDAEKLWRNPPII